MLFDALICFCFFSICFKPLVVCFRLTLACVFTALSPDTSVLIASAQPRANASMQENLEIFPELIKRRGLGGEQRGT